MYINVKKHALSTTEKCRQTECNFELNKLKEQKKKRQDKKTEKETKTHTYIQQECILQHK